MYLKELAIYSDNKIVRNIKFKLGMNLIVDNTPEVTDGGSDGTQTGNNVGKTTVLKLIDYCFHANKSIIYTDPDSGGEYTLVKDFLIDNEVLIKLILKEDLLDESSNEIVIERNFLTHNKAIRRINGNKVKDQEFDYELKTLIFKDLDAEKPTLRQLSSHNIRYKDASINNTLKTLNSFTSDAEYETLYLYLFGCRFDSGGEKQKILTLLNQEIQYQKRLERIQTKSAYQASLKLLDDEIVELEEKQSLLRINENFSSDLDELSRLRYRITQVSSEISNLSIRHELIQETKRDLENEISEIDTQQLRNLYSVAESNLGTLQKKFEDLLKYHNTMIDEKVKFITQELPELNVQISRLKYELNELLDVEKEIKERISTSDSYEDLERLIVQLNEKYKRKGEYEAIISQIDDVEKRISNYQSRLDEIDSIIFSEKYKETITNQIDKFNKYFSKVSKVLYGEQYAIKYDVTINKNNQQPLYKFSAFNTNMSSGKKQGEILCFDIAYILFANGEKMPSLKFLLNDKKELMHDNQLVKVGEYIENKKLQFVASILKDKLPSALNKKENIILELSQTDKLFRIEQTE